MTSIRHGAEEHISDPATPTVDITAQLTRANALLEEEEVDDARAVLEHARLACERAGDRANEALALRALGDLERARRRPTQALAFYERALARRQELGDRAGSAELLLCAGDMRRALGRTPKAIEAYEQAGSIAEALGTLLGQADAAFKLADVVAKSSPEMAQWQFARAMVLYDEHDRQTSGGSMRISNPHLPDRVDDCRTIEPWIMAKVAERELAKLRPTVEAPVSKRKRREQAEAAASSAQPETVQASPVGRDAKVAAAILGLTSALFVGVTVLAGVVPGIYIPAGRLPFVAVAVLATVAAWFATRGAGLQSKALSQALPFVVGAVVYGASSTLFVDHRRTVGGEDAAWDEMVRDPGDVGEIAVVAVTTVGDEAKRDEYARTLARYEAAGDRQGQADTLRASADYEASLGQAERAAELYGRSATLYREIEKPSDAAAMVLAAGEQLRASYRPTAAARRFAEAAALFQQGNKLEEQSLALRKRGDAERAAGNLDAARSSYLEALAVAQKRNDNEARVALLLRIGRVETSARQENRAREALNTAMALAEKRGDAAAQSRTWLALARLEASLNRAGQANQAFEQAATRAQQARNPRIEAAAWRLRGDFDRKAGRADLAQQRYALALSIAQQSNRRDDQALALLRLAALETNADAARGRFAQAIALYDQLSRPSSSARATVGLGDLEAKLGRAPQARDSYARALASYEQSANVPGQIRTLERLSRLVATSDPAAAKEYDVRIATLKERVQAASLTGDTRTL